MSFHRFRVIAAHTLKTHLQGPVLWLLVLLAALASATIHPTALMPAGDTAGSGRALFINTGFAIAQSLGLVTFFVYSFFAAVLAGLPVLRDEEHGISELLRSTPLRAGEYIFGKLAGAMAALGLALLLHLLIVLTLIQFVPGWNAPEPRGPFHLLNYLLPALLFALPGIWFSAALSFAVGVRTRQPLLVFVVPVLLFLLTDLVFNAWPFTGISPWTERLLMILDPSGLRWLRQTAFSVDRGAEYYNTASMGLDGMFVLSRLFTLGVPLLAVLTSVRHYGRADRTEGLLRRWLDRLRRNTSVAAEARTVGTVFRSLGSLQMKSFTPSLAAGTLQVFRAELRELRAQPGLYFFALLILAAVAELALGAESAGAPVLLTAGGLAVDSLGLLTFLGCLLLLFTTVESMHREKITGLDAILYSGPLRSGALLLGKGLANAALIGLILLACLALGLLLLAVQPQGRLELVPFLLVWGPILLPSLFLWTTFVLLLLAVLQDRFAVYAAGLVALMLTARHALGGEATWISNWTLTGALRWSDLGTFQLNRDALLLNRGMVLGLGVLLAAIAVRLQARTERDATALLHRLAPGRLAAQALRLAPFALVPVVLAGILEFQVSTGFQGPIAAARATDYWRQNVEVWGKTDTAAVTHIDLQVDLWPAQHSADLQGTYTMVNDTPAPLHRLIFTVGPARKVAWTVNGAAIQSEDRSGLHVLQLASALPPGQSLQVGFAYHARFPDGFTRNGGGIEQFVLPSGTSLHTLRNSFLPVPGFVEGIGLSAENRALPAPFDPDQAPEQLGPAVGDTIPFTTRVQVTAPSEYTVSSVGEKTDQQTRDGKTTVVWESRVPVRALNLAAGRWTLRQGEGVAVYHHAAHPYNVDEMLATLAAARKRYSQWFTAYPWPELRLVELPDEVTLAQGFPSNIPFSEGAGFLSLHAPGLRQAFLVTAHEAAHQWWGNLLNPGDGPGADVLIEGMAHYAALLLHESELGLRARIDLARLLEQRYLEQRRVDTERPLARLDADSREGDETLAYDKGAWAMWMLHAHLGRERMLAALQELFRRYQAPADGNFLSMQAFLDLLRSYAADAVAYQAFVDQWFHQVVLPELRIRGAQATRAADGWEVSATVENIGTGNVTVELAVASGPRFLEDADQPQPGYTEQRLALHLQPAQPQSVHWKVPFRPHHIIADPDALLLQLNRDQAQADL